MRKAGTLMLSERLSLKLYRHIHDYEFDLLPACVGDASPLYFLFGEGFFVLSRLSLPYLVPPRDL